MRMARSALREARSIISGDRPTSEQPNGSFCSKTRNTLKSDSAPENARMPRS